MLFCSLSQLLFLTLIQFIRAFELSLLKSLKRKREFNSLFFINENQFPGRNKWREGEILIKQYICMLKRPRSRDAHLVRNVFFFLHSARNVTAENPLTEGQKRLCPAFKFLCTLAHLVIVLLFYVDESKCLPFHPLQTHARTHAHTGMVRRYASMKQLLIFPLRRADNEQMCDPPSVLMYRNHACAALVVRWLPRQLSGKDQQQKCSRQRLIATGWN